MQRIALAIIVTLASWAVAWQIACYDGKVNEGKAFLLIMWFAVSACAIPAAVCSWALGGKP